MPQPGHVNPLTLSSKTSVWSPDCSELFWSHMYIGHCLRPAPHALLSPHHNIAQQLP